MPDPSASTEEMDRLFQPRSRLLAMAAFEAALAAASAEAGVVPKAAAAVIADVCASESFDADEIFEAQRLAGNPAIPFVRQLTERVARRDAGRGGLGACRRHQPGCHRHRHHASRPRRAGDSRAAISSACATASPFSRRARRRPR